MKKILVPTDFSKEATNAMHFATQLARKAGSEILLLHVLEVPYGSFSIMGEIHTDYSFEQLYQVQLVKKTQERLEELVSAMEEQGVSAKAKLEFGNPFEFITENVTDEQVDLVVMGSKGASGLSEILIGSNAERVIRHAKCPVFTIKGETNLDGIKSMAFASDMSEEQDEIVKNIKSLQTLLGLKIHMVRVKTPYNYLTEGQALQQLKDFVARNKFENYSIGTVEAEFADEGILRFANENDVGMIAMGTHGRTGLAHFFGGSTAEDVANHSNIPIWTIKLEGVLEAAS